MASSVVVMLLDSEPHVPTSPRVMTPSSEGVIDLPARHGVVHGEKLQFEPQPYKNTIGYWVNVSDWAEWTFKTEAPGNYDVRMLQGCGRGQGGSEVDLRIGDQSIKFRVTETGHFQSFRWRDIGTVTIPAAGSHRLQLRPVRLAKNAVMDVRAIRLTPQADRADASQTSSRRPNVLIIYTDDQGTLDASCYGSRDLFTPNIDGLAANGVRFTQYYAHTVCCPSRALLLTGRHPQRSGVNQWLQGDMRQSPPSLNMSLGELTLAEVFQGAGYQTALFGKWHLGAAPTHGPTKQGFHEFFGHRGGFIDNFSHFYLHRQGYHDLYRGTDEQFHRGEYFPDLVVSETERFLAANRDRPFFLYVAMNTPHYPEQSDTMFDQFYADHPPPRQSYAKFVSTTDDRIGRIVRKLDLLGLRENTIIVFASDNGHSEEDFQISVDGHSSGYPKGHNYGPFGGGGNTGKWRGSKNTFFEGGLRVPAIISAPRQLPSGEIRDQVVSAADWFPTLVELCGIDRPNVKLDGASLLPIIRDNVASHHDVLHWQWFDRWAVRRGKWKLVHDKRLHPANAPNDFLANLEDEQPERTNHAQEQPELVQELTELHNAWLQEVSGQ